MKRSNFLLSMIATSAILFGCSKENVPMDEVLSQGGTKSDENRTFTPSRRNDSLALVAIYNALGGENWEYCYWKRTPMRYWNGIKFADINGEQRVVALELYGSRIKGQLPKEIGMLTELRTLRMAGSDCLRGSIIDEVYDLKKLKVLDFRFTELTGELSPRIGQLTELDTLILWKSQFKAHTWDENGKIQWHDGRNTELFSGSIPHEIGRLTKLKFLNFSRCGFTGVLPEELGNLTALDRLDLSECRFTGSIPASLGNLRNATWMALSVNQLTGSIPAELCRAENLETLILSDNQLTGSIPEEIGQLKQLNYFSIANNHLTGSLPVSMEENARLGIFYANDNQLSGTIPSQLGRRHPLLVYVHLENNQLTGSLPDIVGNDWGTGVWTCQFFVANNRMTGVVPDLLLRFPDSLRKKLLPQQPGFGFENFR
ncbi:MAG: hypothetical protein RSC80_06000 [Odoribacter sp.]